MPPEHPDYAHCAEPGYHYAFSFFLGETLENGLYFKLLECYVIQIFTHFKFCLAIATQWVKIAHFCLISDPKFANLDV